MEVVYDKLGSFPVNHEQLEWALVKVDFEHDADQLQTTDYTKKHIVLFIVGCVVVEWGHEGVDTVLELKEYEDPSCREKDKPEEELGEQVKWVDEDADYYSNAQSVLVLYNLRTVELEVSYNDDW